MIIFKRTIEERVRDLLFKGKAILIFGPRQAGKTTVAKKIIASYGKDGAYFNCDLAEVRMHFVEGEPKRLRDYIGNKKIVVFDEAQTITNIGHILKAFLDTYKDVQIIATGSSSFDLANKINEPLTGRAFEFTLYPLSLHEIYADNACPKDKFYELLKTGQYPEVVSERNHTTKLSLLKNIATNYLYKDVFIFESIKNPLIFEKLIQMLAFQIGNLVSINELAISLGTSRTSIEKYMRLLEQSYIIKRVHTFSRNKRNELKKAFKVYFIDLGIRNAVIGALDDVSAREDKGNVFENFVFLELLKTHLYEAFPPQIYFWRTDTKLEVDFILIKNNAIEAIEVKWKTDNISFQKFLKQYPQASTRVITTETYTNSKTPQQETA